MLMFCVGLIMTGTLALLPTMLQNLMTYPALTTGLVMAPRGIGTMAAMFLVARLIKPGGSYIALLFPLDQHKGGPPFAVSAEEEEVNGADEGSSRAATPLAGQGSASAARPLHAGVLAETPGTRGRDH